MVVFLSLYVITNYKKTFQSMRLAEIFMVISSFRMSILQAFFGIQVKSKASTKTTTQIKDDV